MMKVSCESKILFLDIDGVLNGHEWIHSKRVIPKIVHSKTLIMQSFFEQCPDIKVVISSTWGTYVHNGLMTVKGFSKMLLSHGLNCNIIGVLKTTNNPIDRSQVINEWVIKNKPNKYAIVDDMNINSKYLVRTNPAIGVQSCDLDLLLSIFK